MSEGVEAALDRYRAHRSAWVDTREATFATLTPRRGGPLERGYPEDPKKKADATAAPQALNVEAP